VSGHTTHLLPKRYLVFFLFIKQYAEGRVGTMRKSMLIHRTAPRGARVGQGFIYRRA
jgi:hypothetical protein